MANTIDPLLAAVLTEYDCDPKTDVWNCHGVWVAYHRTLEKIAAKADITFYPPTVIESNGKDGVVAICVTGLMGDKTEWSFGEAAPKNNKNSYPYAMAEKRAKDRVIIKLVGLHGIYSEEEADDFKAPPTHTSGGITEMHERTVKNGNQKSSSQAKKDGEQALFDLVKAAGSKDEVIAVYQEHKTRIEALPANWQNLFWQDYDSKLAEFAEDLTMAG